jgi:hypothetical protein
MELILHKWAMTRDGRAMARRRPPGHRREGKSQLTRAPAGITGLPAEAAAAGGAPSPLPLDTFPAAQVAGDALPGVAGQGDEYPSPEL